MELINVKTFISSFYFFVDIEGGGTIERNRDCQNN